MEFRPAFQADRSTVCWEQDEATLACDPVSRPLLYTEHSHLCYTRRFYYGLCRGMCFQYMFDRDAGIRFANGVTGAGPHNPAWDYQWIVRPVEVGRERTMQIRALYKPFVSRADCLAESDRWQASLGPSRAVDPGP